MIYNKIYFFIYYKDFFFLFLQIVINYKKKNFFSDIDIEYRCDDSKIDISWLRELKLKLQLIDYSRNKNVKKRKSGKLSKKLFFREML